MEYCSPSCPRTDVLLLFIQALILLWCRFTNFLFLIPVGFFSLGRWGSTQIVVRNQDNFWLFTRRAWKTKSTYSGLLCSCSDNVHVDSFILFASSLPFSVLQHFSPMITEYHVFASSSFKGKLKIPSLAKRLQRHIGALLLGSSLCSAENPAVPETTAWVRCTPR